MKLSGVAASVTGSAVGQKIAQRFRSPEANEDATRAALVGNAQKMVRAMGELKGAAMKLGQMLSVVPDQFPEEIRSELAALQKDTPPMPYDMVAAQFERGTGTALRDAFAYFDPEPVGAASIGQVHEARLFDGQRVAVKVQYPGILDTLDSDLKNLGSLMQMGRVVADKERLDEILEELRQGILDEADYELEAANIGKFGPLFTEHPDVVVPTVRPELSGSTVLTMDFLEGEKLDTAILALPDGARQDAAERFSKIFVWMFHERFALHADPHPGNFLLTPEGKIGLLDFGCVRTYEPTFCDGWLKILVAKWAHDKSKLRPAFDALGFQAMKGSAGLDNQQLHELTEITCAPFLYDRDFDWSAWQPRPALEAYTKANLSVLNFASPPEAVFYYRVAAGVWGMLNRAGVKANYHRIAKSTAERRGLL